MRTRGGVVELGRGVGTAGHVEGGGSGAQQSLLCVSHRRRQRCWRPPRRDTLSMARTKNSCTQAARRVMQKERLGFLQLLNCAQAR